MYGRFILRLAALSHNTSQEALADGAGSLDVYPRKGTIAVGSDADIALWIRSARSRFATS
jgi:imidazolonepropionase-like amidohydrolase